MPTAQGLLHRVKHQCDGCVAVAQWQLVAAIDQSDDARTLRLCDHHYRVNANKLAQWFAYRIGDE